MAIAWSAAQTATVPRERRDVLCAASNVLLRTLVALVVAERMLGPPTDELQRRLRALGRASDGDFSQFVHWWAKQPRNSAAGERFDDLRDWMLKGGAGDTPGHLLLRQLVEARNAARHKEASANDAVVAKRTEALEALLRRVMSALAWMAESRWFTVAQHLGPGYAGGQRGRFKVLNGGHVVPSLVVGEWDGDLEAEVVYAALGRGEPILRLSPLCEYRSNAHREGGAALHLFDGFDASEHLIAREPTAAEGPNASSSDSSVTIDALCRQAGTVKVATWKPAGAWPFESEVPRIEALRDRFSVEDQLGRGGAGEVYRVRDLSTNGVAALKVLRADHALNADARARLERESRALQGIAHPNVLPVLEVGETDGGDPYLLVRLATGGSVADVLRKGDVPAGRVNQMVRQAAAGIAALHRAGIVHRDIKPSNLLLERDVVWVSDLGIAYADSDTKLTRTTDGIGTPQYMAPEQHRRARVDAAADVYALGVVAHELATGSLPELRPGAGVPGALGAWIRKMAHADPAKRPDAESVAESFGVWSSALAPAFGLKRSALVAIGVCALASIGVAALAAAWSWFATPRVARPPESFVTIPNPARESGIHELSWLPYVTQTRSVAFSTTEVTRAQWQQHMRHIPAAPEGCDERCPVTNINWWEAVAYLNARSEAEGVESCYELVNCEGVPGDRRRGADGMRCEDAVASDLLSCEGYRLPTRAEWAQAAFATLRSNPNSDVLRGIAQLRDSNGRSGDDAPVAPVAVAGLLADANGLYDLFGNAAEWMHDWGNSPPDQPVVDPVGPSGPEASKAHCGSSIRRSAGTAKHGGCSGNGVGETSPTLGFRAVRTVAPYALPFDATMRTIASDGTVQVRSEPGLSSQNRIVPVPRSWHLRVTGVICGDDGYRWAAIEVPPIANRTEGAEMNQTTAALDAPDVVAGLVRSAEHGLDPLPLFERGVAGWSALYLIVPPEQAAPCCRGAWFVSGHGCCLPSSTADACARGPG